ncbi:MAG: 4-(cytidine 5'-diphospho)-2-C-methyl-D-erythritol kinase [Oscillibacter sp.]|nr:4-(cytidine 5'-diphospho)-2-C-methyl-D-erythritol kinase [Oscillibacter sp.]
MTLTAPAKVNLALDVLGRRKDGYHDLRSVMQSVSLCDTLRVEDGGARFTLLSNCADIPRDGSMEQRAAEAFFEAIEKPVPPVTVTLTKTIPAYAGLGGGSADVAAVLRYLRTRFAPEMPTETLEAIGAKIGSDVPFCIRGGAALAEGRGEKLTPLPPLPPCHFVLCKPNFSLKTPEMYACLDTVEIPARPDVDGLAAALRAGDLQAAARCFGNVFEAALPEGGEAVFAIKRRLFDFGALAAQMSGSGPTVFGVFEREADALAAADDLRRDFSAVFLAHPVPETV